MVRTLTSVVSAETPTLKATAITVTVVIRASTQPPERHVCQVVETPTSVADAMTHIRKLTANTDLIVTPVTVLQLVRIARQVAQIITDVAFAETSSRSRIIITEATAMEDGTKRPVLVVMVPISLAGVAFVMITITSRVIAVENNLLLHLRRMHGLRNLR